LNIAFLKRKSNPFGNRTSRIARLANGQGQHNPTWGVAPGYDEYRLWRKKPGVAFAPSNIATGSIGQRPYTP
jgi:hypothetical protein